MAAPPGAAPGNRHAAAVRRHPSGRARSPRSRPRGSNPPVPFAPAASRRASPGVPPTRVDVGEADHRPPDVALARVRRMRLRSTTTSSSQRRPLREGSASWRRRAPVRPETREPGSSRSPAGVVVGNRPLAGARWRGRRSAPQRGFCSRKRANVCGRRGVGAFRPGVSIYSLLCRSPLRGPCSSRADSGRRGGTEGRGRGSPVPAGTAKGSGSRACASWQPPAAQSPTDRSYLTAHHHIDGRCHMDLFELLGTLDPDVTPGRSKLHLATWNGVHDPLDRYIEGVFDEWQPDQNRRNFSTCEFIVALIAMPEPTSGSSPACTACSGRSHARVKTAFTTGRLVAWRATSLPETQPTAQPLRREARTPVDGPRHSAPEAGDRGNSRATGPSG